MIRFNELFRTLIAGHPEWSRRVCVIAARFYLGVETPEDMLNRINPPNQPWRHATLTRDEYDDIVRWR